MYLHPRRIICLTSTVATLHGRLSLNPKLKNNWKDLGHSVVRDIPPFREQAAPITSCTFRFDLCHPWKLVHPTHCDLIDDS